MIHGTYIGRNKELIGESALLRDDSYSKTRMCLAQFDNLEKFGKTKNDYAFGWHSFYWYEFELDKEDK